MCKTFRLSIVSPSSPINTVHIQYKYAEITLVPYPQIRREPRPFPKLRIKRKVERVDDFQPEDFEIYNYDPHPAIKMQMAV